MRKPAFCICENKGGDQLHNTSKQSGITSIGAFCSESEDCDELARICYLLLTASQIGSQIFSLI